MYDDWRLRGQEAVLSHRKLKWADWFPYREGWDHDHCEFCWAKISDRPIDDHTTYNSAWVTANDNYSWICPNCFEDFRRRFQWSVEKAPPTS